LPVSKDPLGLAAAGPAGVPPDGCAEGFISDKAGGCIAVLPDGACAVGTLAIPGETECRPVAPCGPSRWGDAPIDGATQFVDGSYNGGLSDGSEAQPWTGVQEAIDAAAEGAVIAIAAGTYPGSVAIRIKPVRLWGKCPGEVEIVGEGDAAGIEISAAADGTELHDLALSGSMSFPALGVWASQGVVVERVWIHDVPTVGIYINEKDRPAAVALVDVLVERTGDAGIFVDLAAATLDRTVVRDVASGTQGWPARGLQVYR
jgi:hypothetical protein